MGRPVSSYLLKYGTILGDFHVGNYNKLGNEVTLVLGFHGPGVKGQAMPQDASM